MKKCINLANSTFNLSVLYIKLAKKTKQFRRLVLENFIASSSFFFIFISSIRRFTRYSYMYNIIKCNNV